MITQLFAKQIDVELERIYDNFYNFVKHFFSEHEAIMVDDEEMTFYFAFTGHCIYSKRFWDDPQGNLRTLDQEIDFEDYNKWCKDLE